MERQKILQRVTQGTWNWDPALNCPLEESLTLPLRQTRRLTPPGQATTPLLGHSHYTEYDSENSPGIQSYLDLRKINEGKVLQTRVKASWMKHIIQECSATGKETGNRQNCCFIASHGRSVSTITKAKQNKIKDRCFLLEFSQFTNHLCSAIE